MLVQFQYLNSFKFYFKYQFYWKQSLQFMFLFKLLEYHCRSRDFFTFSEITDNTSKRYKTGTYLVEKEEEIMYGLSNDSNCNDLQWSWRLLLLFETFLTTISEEM